MKLSDNFSLEEMTSSSVASNCGIKNIPNTTDIKYITELITSVLQPIRNAYNQPITISSGYRSTLLNKKIGGASNSDHLYGCAADIQTKSNTLSENKKLWDIIISLKNSGKLKCRQIIWEYGKKGVGPKWIHISINNKYNSKKDNQIVYIGI